MRWELTRNGCGGLAIAVSALLIRRMTWTQYLSAFIEESLKIYESVDIPFSRLPPALPQSLTITEGSCRKWGK